MERSPLDRTSLLSNFLRTCVLSISSLIIKGKGQAGGPLLPLAYIPFQPAPFAVVVVLVVALVAAAAAVVLQRKTSFFLTTGGEGGDGGRQTSR